MEVNPHRCDVFEAKGAEENWVEGDAPSDSAPPGGRGGVRPPPKMVQKVCYFECLVLKTTQKLHVLFFVLTQTSIIITTMKYNAGSTRSVLTLVLGLLFCALVRTPSAEGAAVFHKRHVMRGEPMRGAEEPEVMLAAPEVDDEPEMEDGGGLGSLPLDLLDPVDVCLVFCNHCFQEVSTATFTFTFTFRLQGGGCRICTGGNSDGVLWG